MSSLSQELTNTAWVFAIADQADWLWQNGTLHLVVAAPKEDYKWRITIAPAVEIQEDPQEHMETDFCGVMLKWVGDRFYIHMALRAGVGEGTTSRRE